jgi:predicted RNase H-like HicB family nuclease
MATIENNELIFEVTQDADGGFVAECLTQPIVTQGGTWDELRNMVLDAVDAFLFDAPKP